jgi:hypothetical protein
MTKNAGIDTQRCLSEPAACFPNCLFSTFLVGRRVQDPSARLQLVTLSGDRQLRR